MTLWLYAVSIHTKITVRYTYIVQTLQQNCSSPTVSRFLSPYSLHLAAGGWQNSTPLENGVFQHVSICCVGSGAQEEGKLWRDSPLAMLQQCTLMCEAAISQKRAIWAGEWVAHATVTHEHLHWQSEALRLLFCFFSPGSTTFSCSLLLVLSSPLHSQCILHIQQARLTHKCSSAPFFMHGMGPQRFKVLDYSDAYLQCFFSFFPCFRGGLKTLKTFFV